MSGCLGCISGIVASTTRRQGTWPGGKKCPCPRPEQTALHWCQIVVRTVQPVFPDPQTKVPINPELRSRDHGCANDSSVVWNFL